MRNIDSPEQQTKINSHSPARKLLSIQLIAQDSDNWGVRNWVATQKTGRPAQKRVPVGKKAGPVGGRAPAPALSLGQGGALGDLGKAQQYFGWARGPFGPTYRSVRRGKRVWTCGADCRSRPTRTCWRLLSALGAAKCSEAASRSCTGHTGTDPEAVCRSADSLFRHDCRRFGC